MRTFTIACVGLVVVWFGAPTNAGVIDLGGGWQASFDPGLDGLVDITVDSVTADTIYIQKAAEFTQPPGPGGFPTIPIVFQQIAPSAITSIVINDESITNSTGFDWTDFHWEILDEPDAWFETLGFYFSTSPFDNQTFLDTRNLFVDGFGLGAGGTDAVVADGASWFPGNGPADGELIMNVVSQSQEPFSLFTLKETPTPEPTTLALLSLAGLAAFRRRR